MRRKTAIKILRGAVEAGAEEEALSWNGRAWVHRAAGVVDVWMWRLLGGYVDLRRHTVQTG